MEIAELSAVRTTNRIAARRDLRPEGPGSRFSEDHTAEGESKYKQ